MARKSAMEQRIYLTFLLRSTLTPMAAVNHLQSNLSSASTTGLSRMLLHCQDLQWLRLWRLGHCNLMIVCAPWEFHTNGNHILSSLLCLHTSSWRWSRTSTSSAPLQQGHEEVGDGENESWTGRHHIVMSQSEIIESWVSSLALRAYVSELSIVSTLVAHSSCHLLASHSWNGPDALSRSIAQAVKVATGNYGSKLTFSKWSCIFSLCWY